MLKPVSPTASQQLHLYVEDRQKQKRPLTFDETVSAVRSGALG